MARAASSESAVVDCLAVYITEPAVVALPVPVVNRQEAYTTEPAAVVVWVLAAYSAVAQEHRSLSVWVPQAGLAALVAHTVPAAASVLASAVPMEVYRSASAEVYKSASMAYTLVVAAFAA